MGWGVVKSLELIGSGPVGLVHTQKIEAQSEKPTWTKALEFTQFACPCGTDPRLLSGEQRTSHFKLVTSVDGPISDFGLTAMQGRLCTISHSPPGRKVVVFSNCTKTVLMGHMQRRGFISATIKNQP
jgi:hypothetical protein